MRDIRFKNQIGLTLAGRFEPPSRGQGAAPVVVFAHGFDSGKDSPRGRAVAEKLRQVGLATFLFDFTGHGDSEGTKADSTIRRQSEDLRAAVDQMSNFDNVDAGRIGVCGASSGGLVAFMEVLDDGRVKSLALRGPRTDGTGAFASRFEVPIFIIQGENDPLLPQTEIVFEALRCEKKLEIVAGADHLFSDPVSLKQVVESTAGWFVSTLTVSKKEAA